MILSSVKGSRKKHFHNYPSHWVLNVTAYPRTKQAQTKDSPYIGMYLPKSGLAVHMGDPRHLK